MKISLQDFRGVDGLSRDITVSEPWPVLEFQGQEIEFSQDIAAEFNLERHGAELRLTGTVAALLRLACSRCTEKFDYPVRVKVSEQIPLDRGNDPDEQWGSSYLDSERNELNLSEYALLTVLEQLPLQPLCLPDCHGLCPECGQNLNQSACGCRSEQIDPRLAVLGKLLKHDPK